jgi:hypothetical protein
MKLAGLINSDPVACADRDAHLQRRLPPCKTMGLVQSCSAIFRFGSIGSGVDLVYLESIDMRPDFPYPLGESLLAHEAVVMTSTIAAAAAK